MARIIALVALLTIANQSAIRNLQSAILNSPDGHLRLRLWTDDTHRVRYDVTRDNVPVVEPSVLGFVVDRVDLTRDADIVGSTRSSTDREYLVRGVHAHARDRSNDAHVDLRHRATSAAFAIEMRAFETGVAFRYVAARAGTRTPDDRTEFRLPGDATVWYHGLDGHYEGVHVKRTVADVPFGDWAAPPVTFRLARGGYASITEGALANYSGMALEADGAGTFHARLGHAQPIGYPFYLRYPAADTHRLAAAASVAGPITTPWRIVLAAPGLDALVNSDVVRNVAAPPDPALFPDGASTPWIAPGRAVWRFLDGGDNTFDGLKAFTALAERLGFEYHVVEGIWQRWTPEQLRDFVDDAKRRHVGIWLWKDSRAIPTVDKQREFFDLCRDLGVVGAKIDFFDHEAKEIIDRYQSILREAAERHIMVDFHGADKPTGGDRTFPNELTREGIQGLEHRTMETWATHNATLPFTRFLAGPADYTPVVFGERRKETSWAHQIATAVIFTSPLLVYGAHPQSLLDNPAVDVIKAIPSVWDETRVLAPSDIGELAAFARRSGGDWFVGILNGAQARTLKVDLGFLPAGKSFAATLVRDNPADAAAVAIEKAVVTSATPLGVEMRPGGGFVARLAAAQ